MNTLNTTFFREKYLGQLDQTIQTDGNNLTIKKQEAAADNDSDIQSKTSSENRSQS